MSTWISWPPEDPREKLPGNYWNGDPLGQFQAEIESEFCPECGFKVEFISDKHQYEDWNDHTHDSIAGILEVQRKNGECPSHSKPNWMV